MLGTLESPPFALPIEDVYERKSLRVKLFGPKLLSFIEDDVSKRCIPGSKKGQGRLFISLQMRVVKVDRDRDQTIFGVFFLTLHQARKLAFTCHTPLAP